MPAKPIERTTFEIFKFFSQPGERFLKRFLKSEGKVPYINYMTVYMKEVVLMKVMEKVVVELLRFH